MKTLIIPFLLATALAAQESRKLDPKAELQRALVIEVQEQDPKRALALLEQIVKTSSDVAVTKQAEAERLRILASLQASTREVRERVEAALDRLRKDDEVVWKNGISDLLFAGDACTPWLSKQVEAETNDRLFITRAVQALVEIGTERAAATLERIVEKGDEFQRKAALLGVVAAQKVSEKMRPALGAFVKTGNYKLTVEALDTTYSKLSRDDLIAKLDERECGDASQEVREAACRALRRLGEGGWHDGWQRDGQRVIAVLEKLIENHEAFAARTAVALPLSASSEGRALMLRALAAFPADVATWRRDRQLQFGSFQPSADDEHVELCLAAARALKGEPVGSVARAELAEAIRSLSQRWTRSALSSVVECAELGFGDDRVSMFIARVAKQDDAALVVRALPALTSPARLSEWFTSHDLPSGSADRLRAYLETRLAPNSIADLWLLTALARTREPKQVAWVFELCKSKPESCWVSGVHALLVASKDPITPDIQKALEEALVMNVTSLQQGDYVTQYRNAIFARLVEVGSKAGLEGFARAYELGLTPTPPMDFSSQLFANTQSAYYRGLRWAGANSNRTQHTGLHRVGYDDATSAEVFARVLGSNHPEAWNDAITCADEIDRFPLSVAEKLADLSFDCPLQAANGRQRQQLQRMVASYLLNAGSARSPKAWTYLAELSRRGNARMVQILLAPLTAPLPEAKPVFEAMLESPDTIAFALDRLAKLGAKDITLRTEKLLHHSSPAVRSAASNTIVAIDKARARQLIGVLARDQDSGVRLAFATHAGVLGDQVFVPDLLSLLRDDSEQVRVAAKSSLERIRFLIEQGSFWERQLGEGNVRKPSAAEALLEKAKKDQPKATRLMALDSLGTLGVAETLPILLELCSDDDKEIAEHAAAAVKRINAK